MREMKVMGRNLEKRREESVMALKMIGERNPLGHSLIGLMRNYLILTLLPTLLLSKQFRFPQGYFNTKYLQPFEVSLLE